MEVLNGNNIKVELERFGSLVLVFDQLDIPSIKKGEWVFLTGRNGTGKTTLFNVLTKSIFPQKGEISLFEKKLNSYTTKELSKTLYLINQNPLASTVDELTVEENLVFSTGNPKNKKFDNLLEEINLQNHGKHLVKNLSGGQRQILAFQIAKIRRTKILMLDEPFASLDSDNIDLATKILMQLKERGTTVLFITHDMDYIKHLDTNYRVFRLENKRINEI